MPSSKQRYSRLVPSEDPLPPPVEPPTPANASDASISRTASTSHGHSGRSSSSTAPDLGPLPRSELPQPTVSHAHLPPMVILFTALYAFTSIRLCIWPLSFDTIRACGSRSQRPMSCLSSSFCQLLRRSPHEPRKLPARLDVSADVNPTSRWFCKTCLIMKPIRTHHCRRCNRCVSKMDHHCFWINNCVGLGNMKYFFLTLVYGFCGCAFMVLMMAARWYSLAFGAKDPKPTDVEYVILALATAGSFIHAGTVGYLLSLPRVPPLQGAHER